MAKVLDVHPTSNVAVILAHLKSLRLATRVIERTSENMPTLREKKQSAGWLHGCPAVSLKNV